MVDDIDRFWFKSYEAGVPHEINPDQYASLIEIFEEAVQKHQDHAAFSNMGVALSYREIDALSQCFAGFLQKQVHVQENSRIAIMMPNLLQFPIALFGALRAKMTVVNVNPMYTPRELRKILTDSGASMIVVLENFAHIAEQAIVGTQIEHVVVTQIGDMLGSFKGPLVNFVVKHIKKMVPAWNIPKAYRFQDTIKKKYKAQFTKPRIQNSDLAFLQYTGGTTGGIKGAMLTHRNMIANLLQATAWIKDLIEERLHGGIITALPMYHIFSLTANCLTFFRVGLCNILITNPRDIHGFIKELQRQPFSVMTGVNTLFNALLHNKDFCKLDFSQFKFCLGGGMAVQRAVAEKWYQVTKVVLLEAYGLTEASPAVTINPLNIKAFNGSIGLPISSTDVKICDDNGKECPLGERGELWVRGPQVMLGYWNQPQETANVLTDGWLHTGDVARMDADGFIFIVDRKKDMIIVSGFNVYPNEIEDVIAEMKEVREVAVIGVKFQDHGGEKVKAFIVPNDPSLTAEQVLEHCRTELTSYKIPKEIEFRTELPKTNVGKVLRRALREEEEAKSK